ncbi:MAG: type II secretion system protein N [Candidatus Thiodiazotropha sp. (ex Epidulcina cf. delphinae)]|nr:type II secretion system protein N [Candidatus Thiodiazotropha sp. (ex Epidulcina cf. delphinae)]
MRWWSYLLVGLGGYLLFMLAELPAQHVLGWTLPDTGKPPFSYGRIKGTLWRGKAEVVNYQGIMLDRVKWRFAPSALLRGRIGFDLQLKYLDQRLGGHIAIGAGDDYRLADIKGRIRADNLPRLMNLSQIGIDGKIDIELQHLRIEGQRITSAEGRVRWLDSALLSPISLKAGDLEADLTSNDNGDVKAKIKDMGGTTAVDGELSLTSDGNFSLSGAIKPGAGADPGLGGALKAIGKSQPDGSIRLNYSGSL